MGQLSALFYKNWLLYKRRLFGNILEILVPIFFIYMIIVTKNLDPPTTFSLGTVVNNNTNYSKTINPTAPLTAFLK